MQKLPLKENKNTSPVAPGGEFPITCTGSNFFYTKDASHPNFALVLNDDVKVSGRLALGHIFPEGVTVDKIRVLNLDASRELTVTIVTGKGRPIDEGLNVYTEQVTPTVRTERPSSFSKVEVVCTGLANALPLLPLDCARGFALLFVSAGGEAYYGPSGVAGDWPAVDGNRVGQTLDNSATRYESCAACFVKGGVGVTVYAYVFSF